MRERPPAIRRRPTTTAKQLSSTTREDAVDELAAALELGPRPLTAALVRLADLGAAAWQADGQVRWSGTLSVAAALSASETETEREGEVERSRLEMMSRYSEHTDCRRSYLLL